MYAKEARMLIRRIGLNGRRFANMLRKGDKYVANFNSSGVPSSVAVILKLSDAIKEKGGDPVAVMEKVGSGDDKPTKKQENGDER